MRLIDADALKATIPNTHTDMFENCRNCKLLDEEEVKTLIDNAPSIDIVRCKECGNKDKDWDYCNEHDMKIRPDDFCSYGCRSEKPNNC